MVLYLRLLDFVVGVEQRRDPSLAGRALVVGGAPTSRGFVMAASSEARKAGVEPGVALADAARRCPEAVFRPGLVDRYLDAWSGACEIVATRHQRFEWFGLDEASIDLPPGPAAAARLAADELREQLARGASVRVACGVADTRIAARTASIRVGSPGLLLVLPGYDRAFLQGCPIETMEGLDARAACRLRGMGIGTLGALATLDDRQATSLLGRGGAVLARLARGADTRSAARAAVPARLARMARITREGDCCQEARERILNVAAELSRTLAGLGWTAVRMDIDLDSHDGLLARASDELQFPVTEAGARQVAERLWPALSRHAMTASDFTVRLRGVKSAEAARPLPASARVPAQRCVFGT